MKKSQLERVLQSQLRAIEPEVGEPEWNHRFHPTRGWEIDAAWVDVKVGIEAQGGTYTRTVRCLNCGSVVQGKRKDGSRYPIRVAIGAHSMGSGYTRDIEKSNAAQAMGWCLFQVNADVLENNPVPFLEMVAQTILSRRAEAMPCSDPVTPQERGAVVGWMLASGSGVTSSRVARAANLSPRGARKLLARIARVLPIHNPENGRWERMV